MKRIYRLEREGKLAGICAGLGDLYNIDPTLIRLAVVVLCIATGFWPVIIAYLVGWFIIPEKRELEEQQNRE